MMNLVAQVDAWVEDTVYFSSGGELYNGHGIALVYQNSRCVAYYASDKFTRVCLHVMSNCNVTVTVPFQFQCVTMMEI